MNYTSDSRFDGLYLGDSFHLEFRQTGDTISLGFLFHLEHDHPLWFKPAEDEYGCYKKGWMIFSAVSKAVLRPSNARPATDAAGEMDFGTVDTLKIIDNNFSITTDWGSIDLVAETVTIEFEK